jgi:hypothetical protein
MTQSSAPSDAAATARLVGVWELAEADEGLALDPGALMMFLPTGELRYAVPEGGNLQIALLTFRVEGEWILSDQPSVPRPDRTRFAFDGDEWLALTYDAGRARFRRVG